MDSDSESSSSELSVPESSIPPFDYYRLCQFLEFSSTNGHLNIVKPIVKTLIENDKNKYTKQNLYTFLDYSFHSACINGQINVAKWLWKLHETINFKCNLYYAFSNSCSNGHLVTAKWLWKLYENEVALNKQTRNDQSNAQRCEETQELANTNSKASALGARSDRNFAEVFKNCNNDMYLTFVAVCRSGQLHIAKYLVEINQMPIDREDDIFYNICDNGHLDMAKWYWGLYNITDLSHTFEQVCYKGHLELAQWIWSVDPTINIHGYKEQPFAQACIEGHLELAQWLWSLDGKIDLFVNNHHIFKCVCYDYRRINVAQWLTTLSDLYCIHLNHKHHNIYYTIDGCGHDKYGMTVTKSNKSSDW